MTINGRICFFRSVWQPVFLSVFLLFFLIVKAHAGYLYLLNDDPAGSRIYGFQVNESTGALTALTGFPLATGGLGVNALVSERMIADRANNRLYVINDGSNTVSAYSVNPADGSITAMPFSPIMLDNATWNSINVHPSGSPVVVGDGSTTAGRVASFHITPTTATAATGSPYAMNPSSGFSSVFSRDGNYFYAGGNMGAVFAGFSVNPATGVLTPLVGSPFSSTTGNPVAHAMDSSGRLFVVTTTPEIRVFTTSSGIPTPVTGNPFSPGGLTQRRFGLIHQTGNFYIVAGNSGNNVGVFQIAGTGAATTVTAVSGSPFGTGGTTANALALNQAGSFLYVANRLSRNVTSFAFNSSTGALTGQTVQPSNTLGSAGFINGIAYFALPQITVSVGGRILTSDGQPVSKAIVTMTDTQGATRTALSSPFGYYEFKNVPVGETYTISVFSKRFTFTPQNVFVNSELTNFDITAQP